MTFECHYLDGSITWSHRIPDSLRSKFELILLSDTFRICGSIDEKARLSDPFLSRAENFCNNIEGIRLLPDHKRKTVQYLQKLNFSDCSGDSYNDLGMLKTADHCMLFNPPQNLVFEYRIFQSDAITLTFLIH